MADLASRYYLRQVVNEGDSEPLKLLLRLGEQMVGSQQDVAVPIDLPGVTPMHATFWVQDDAVFLTDLGAEDGTAINDAGLEEGQPTVVEVGDRVRFGSTEFVLEIRQPGDFEADALTGEIELGDGADYDEGSLVDLALAVPSSEGRLAKYFESFCRFCQDAVRLKDHYDLLDNLLAATMRLVDGDRFLVLLGDKLGNLQLRAARYKNEENPDSRPPSDEYLQLTLDSETPVLAFDAQVDERFKSMPAIRKQGVRSALGVRLAATGRRLGVLYVDSCDRAGLYEAEDAELIATLGNVASLALLYLASRTALKDVLIKTKKEIARYKFSSEQMAVELNAHADTLETLADRADEQLSEELQAECKQLRNKTGTFLAVKELKL